MGIDMKELSIGVQMNQKTGLESGLCPRGPRLESHTRCQDI